MAAKNCKVIATCFAGREVREENDFCGDPPGLFTHAQNFPTPESALELLRLVASLESSVDPGMECDTVIVNNDVGWERGNRYLASIDGARTFAGSIRVLTRENYGSSAGAYAHAYAQLGSEYEYWTFTEDDILVIGDRYLARCVELLRGRAGFVAIQGLSRAPALHAHGGVGTTHVSVLDAVRRVWGSLPHRDRHESQDAQEHSIWGEVMFTHIMSRMGYPLLAFGQDPPLYRFAYDYMKAEKGLPVTARSHPLLPRVLRRVARAAGQWADDFDRKDALR